MPHGAAPLRLSYFILTHPETGSHNDPVRGLFIVVTNKETTAGEQSDRHPACGYGRLIVYFKNLFRPPCGLKRIAISRCFYIFIIVPTRIQGFAFFFKFSQSRPFSGRSPPQIRCTPFFLLMLKQQIFPAEKAL